MGSDNDHDQVRGCGNNRRVLVRWRGIDMGVIEKIIETTRKQLEGEGWDG